jgi:ABC-type transport system substrate-binding protein
LSSRLHEGHSIIDPSVMLQRYFGTGGSPRIGYSNPELDKLPVKERETFDHDAWMKVLHQAMGMINDEAPAIFLWRHQMARGLSKSIAYAPDVNGYIYGTRSTSSALWPKLWPESDEDLLSIGRSGRI